MKKGVFKKTIASIMSIALIFSGFTFTSSVKAQDLIISGSCGTNAVFELNQTTGVLTISGTGKVSNSVRFRNYEFDKLIVEEGITGFSYSSFGRCTSMKELELPSTLTDFGEYSFEICTGLESITVAAGNNNYVAEDGILYNKNKTELVLFPSGKDVDEFTVPSSVTTLGEYAFDYNQHIVTVSLPAALTSLGGEPPFYKAAVLEHIVIDENNSKYMSEDDIIYSKDGKTVYRRATASSVTEVTFPDTVKTVNDYSLCDAYNLEEVTIPSSVTRVGYSAFDECPNLKKITVYNPDCVVEDMITVMADGQEDCVIYGYAGSTAQTFANSANLEFREIGAKEAVSATITSMPKKTTFAIDDNFNSTGLEVQITYSDDTTMTRTSGFTFEGFDSSTLGTQTITVSIEGVSVTYDIEIVEELEIPTIELNQLTPVDIIEEDQTAYFYFTPHKTGVYEFYAISDSDTYGAIYDDNNHLIAENYDKGDDDEGDYVLDFYISRELEKGKTYLLGAQFEVTDELGTFNVIVEGDATPDVQTYDVTIDGEVVATVEEGSEYVLPTAANVGYFGDGALYKGGSTYTVNKDISFSSVNLRMGKVPNLKYVLPAGIRFQGKIVCADEGLFSSGSIIESGLLVVPNDYLINGEELSLNSDVKFSKIKTTVWVNNVLGSFATSFDGILEKNYERDFVSRGYMIVEYADGTRTAVYSAVSTPTSVSELAFNVFKNKTIYNSLNDTNKQIVLEYMG